MKKIIIGILTGAALFGGVTFVAADSIKDNFFDFEDMKPFMEEMHPELSTEQQEEMFNFCHGENKVMEDNAKFRGMMNNF